MPGPEYPSSPRGRRKARTALLAKAIGRSARITRRAYDLGLTRLPPDKPALRIAHITDLHVGRVTPEARLVEAIEAANAYRPDIVCLTGDYVAHSLRYLPRLTHHLKALEAPAFATLGNHDYWQDAAAVTRALESAGVHVLFNESVAIDTTGGRWWVVGIDDAVTGHHDVARAFSRCGSQHAIVLSHLAELAPECAERGAAIVLCGHTHGGQVSAAGLTHMLMRQMGHRYIVGWYAARDTAVYVNRGVGAAVFPFRGRGARAEVAGVAMGPAPRAGPAIRITAGEAVGRWPAARHKGSTIDIMRALGHDET